MDKLPCRYCKKFVDQASYIQHIIDEHIREHINSIFSEIDSQEEDTREYTATMLSEIDSQETDSRDKSRRVKRK